MKLPNYILFVLERLKDYEAYVVGGSVRDYLLKREINDYDITTSASTDKIQHIFNDHHMLLNGIKHGTVTIIKDHHNIEITTYRIDGNYINHRQPTSVTFTTSLKEDLSRRDFTINALCYNPNTGIIDMFDGIKDLNKHIIRCIGNPNKRFDEDALRILRALRFASELNFSIEENTSIAIHKNKELLKYLSKERITNELKTILTINNPNILNEYTDILNYLFNINIDKKILTTLQKSKDFITTLSILSYFNDIKILNNLSLSNLQKETIKNNLKYHQEDLNNKIILKNLMAKKIDIPKLCLFIQTIHDIDSTNILNNYQNIIKNNEPFLLKHLAINGKDLINLNINPTKIGNILNECLQLVIENNINNNHDELLQKATQLSKD